MATVTLDTTLSGENSNSYVDVATCDDYWANHWNSVGSATWDGLTPTGKVNLLMQACRVIESVKFTNKFLQRPQDYKITYSTLAHKLYTIPLHREPVRYLWYQRLQFPRNYDIWFTDEGGGTVGDTYIPDPIKFAQCEQALYIVSLDTSALSNQLQGVSLEKISLGKGEISSTQEYSASGSMISPVVKSLIQPYILTNSKVRRA